MDFQETCDFFGGTIFYEDLRGDFASIRGQLERRRIKTALVLIHDAASLLLLYGIWHLLSGELGDASQYLECLIRPGVWGQEWKFRGNTYTALLRLWRRHPPLF